MRTSGRFIPVVIGFAVMGATHGPGRAPLARPPAAVIAPVEKDLRDHYHLRRLAPQRMFRAIDLNGDGESDWIADFDKSGEGGWCGTGGCRQMIFASQGGRFRVVFDAQIREMKMRNSGGAFRLDLDVHGSNCGTFGAAACPASFLWDKGHARFVEAATPGGETRVHGSLIQNVEPDPVPTLVQHAVAARQQRCAVEFRTSEDLRGTASSVPDLDGDGVRDWVVGAASCEFSDPKTQDNLETSVFVGTGAAVHRSLSFPGSGYQIDIATRPAQLVQLVGDDCGYDTICGEKIWRWDAAIASFAVAAEHPKRPRPSSD